MYKLIFEGASQGIFSEYFLIAHNFLLFCVLTYNFFLKVLPIGKPYGNNACHSSCKLHVLIHKILLKNDDHNLIICFSVP